MVSKFLVRVCLVSEQDLIIGLYESYRAARNEQLRLQMTIPRQHAHDRLAALHGLAGLDLLAGYNSRDWRDNSQPSARDILHTFLLKQGEILLECRFRGLMLARQLIERLDDLLDHPARGNGLSLQCLHLTLLCERCRFLLLDLEEADVTILFKEPEAFQRLLCNPDLIPSCQHFGVELRQLPLCVGKLPTQSLLLRAQPHLLGSLYRPKAGRPALEARFHRSQRIPISGGGSRNSQDRNYLTRFDVLAFGTSDFRHEPIGGRHDLRDSIDWHKLSTHVRTVGIGAKCKQQHYY